MMGNHRPRASTFGQIVVNLEEFHMRRSGDTHLCRDWLNLLRQKLLVLLAALPHIHNADTGVCLGYPVEQASRGTLPPGTESHSFDNFVILLKSPSSKI